jgi:UDP-2,3-diacylglucosamine hydrolase
MHGNRDFLLGELFMQDAGATLLPDPTVVDLYGTPTLVTHGDTLCTEDRDYQDFRRMVRDPHWQAGFLAQPLAQRKAQIEELRRKSETEKSMKPADIMDVNQDAVAAAFRAHHYPRLIHGHTHRPARHEHRIDGMLCERWVLTDWYETGGYLRCDSTGCSPFPVSN